MYINFSVESNSGSRAISPMLAYFFHIFDSQLTSTWMLPVMWHSIPHEIVYPNSPNVLFYLKLKPTYLCWGVPALYTLSWCPLIKFLLQIYVVPSTCLKWQSTETYLITIFWDISQSVWVLKWESLNPN